MSNKIEDYTDEELVSHYRDMQHLSVDASTKEGLDNLRYYQRLVREMARRFAILVEANEVQNRVQNILNQEYFSKEDIDEAIAEIMRSDIPLEYVDENERTAFSDGQGDALSKLTELLGRNSE